METKSYYSPEFIELLKRNVKLSPETFAAMHFAGGCMCDRCMKN